MPTVCTPPFWSWVVYRRALTSETLPFFSEKSHVHQILSELGLFLYGNSFLQLFYQKSPLNPCLINVNHWYFEICCLLIKCTAYMSFSFFLCSFLGRGVELYSWQDLSSLASDWTQPTALKALHPNHQAPGNSHLLCSSFDSWSVILSLLLKALHSSFCVCGFFFFFYFGIEPKCWHPSQSCTPREFAANKAL